MTQAPLHDSAELTRYIEANHREQLPEPVRRGTGARSMRAWSRFSTTLSNI